MGGDIHANVFKGIRTGSQGVTQAKFGVTNVATLLAGANDQRRSVRISNLGATRLWLGASSDVEVGVSGINFGWLSEENNTVIEDYSGPIWGRVGGASTFALWVGVADIG